MENINNFNIQKDQIFIEITQEKQLESVIVEANKITSLTAELLNPLFENALKVLNNGFDFYGNLGAVSYNAKVMESAKNFRTPVQSLQQIHFIATGKATYNPQNVMTNKEGRFKFIKTMFTTVSLFKSGLAYTEQLVHQVYEKADFSKVTELANSSFKVIKCANKVSAFEMAYRNWANLPPDASEASLIEARLRLCSTSINLTSELAKIAYLLSGNDMPNKIQQLINIAAVCASIADIRLMGIDWEKQFDLKSSAVVQDSLNHIRIV